MKTCSKCKHEKPLTEFGSKDKSGRLQTFCKPCNREYLREHYSKNKQYYFDKNKRNRDKIADYLRDLKTETPCADCGQRFHYACMDFDHLRDKKFNISHFARNLSSIKKLKEELDKCELVCANCHRLRTFNRRQQSGLV